MRKHHNKANQCEGRGSDINTIMAVVTAINATLQINLLLYDLHKSKSETNKRQYRCNDSPEMLTREEIILYCLCAVVNVGLCIFFCVQSLL